MPVVHHPLEESIVGQIAAQFQPVVVAHQPAESLEVLVGLHLVGLHATLNGLCYVLQLSRRDALLWGLRVQGVMHVHPLHGEITLRAEWGVAEHLLTQMTHLHIHRTTRQLARQGVNHHREHHIFFFPDIHTFTQYAHVAVQHGWHPYIAVALNGQQVGNHLAVVIRHHHHVGLVAWRPQAQFHQLSTVEVAALRQLGQCGGVCMDGDFHTAKLYHFFRTTKYLGVGIWQLLIF